MSQLFKIGKVQVLGSFNTISKWDTVSEELFYSIVSDKVKELTADQSDKFSETLNMVISHLNAGTKKSSECSLIVCDLSFKVIGIK